MTQAESKEQGDNLVAAIASGREIQRLNFGWRADHTAAFGNVQNGKTLLSVVGRTVMES